MRPLDKIFLHATYRCNADCLHCAVPKGRAIIDPALYKRLLRISADESVSHLIIGGGEPLLHPQIESMLEQGHEAGLKVKLETNARLLDERCLERIAPSLFQLNISLDGATAETHDRIRGTHAFETALQVIASARRLGIDVAVWTAAMTLNIGELEDLVRRVRSSGAEKLAVLYATPVGNCYANRDSLLVPPTIYYPLMKRLFFSGDKSFQIRVAPYTLPAEYLEDFERFSGAASLGLGCLIKDQTILHVDPLGDIYPCVLLLNRKECSLGNIQEEGLFHAILNRDPIPWELVLRSVKEGEDAAAQREYMGSNCIALANAYDVAIDPRFIEGIPCCPCKTINKEWENK